MSNFLSVDTMVMFGLALVLDIGGFVCFVLCLIPPVTPFMLVISQILDIVGLVLFSVWILFRGGGLKGKPAKILKRLWKGSVAPTLVESIPVFGDVATSWIISVYLTAKNG